MNKLIKFLRRLSAKERRSVEECLEKILTGQWSDLDIKKLKGYKDVYRVRQGQIRVIFNIKNQTVRIIAIERRSENTYRDF